MNDTELYAAARKVADIFYENVTTDYDCDDAEKPWFEDCRYNSVIEPLDLQASEGLYLGYDYSDIPSMICTPLGLWKYARTGIYTSYQYQKNALVKAVKSRVALQSNQVRLVQLSTGGICSFYGILKVDGKALPPPSFKEKGEFMSYGDAWDKWAELTAAYVPA